MASATTLVTRLSSVRILRNVCTVHHRLRTQSLKVPSESEREGVPWKSCAGDYPEVVRPSWLALWNCGHGLFDDDRVRKCIAVGAYVLPASHKQAIYIFHLQIPALAWRSVAVDTRSDSKPVTYMEQVEGRFETPEG